MYRVYKEEVERYIKNCRKLLAIPYVWNKEENLFQVETESYYTKLYKTLQWVMRIHFVLMCLAHGQAVLIGRETLQFKTLSVGALAVYFTNAYISTIHNDAGNVVLLLNRVISYEGKYDKQGKN